MNKIPFGKISFGMACLLLVWNTLAIRLLSTNNLVGFYRFTNFIIFLFWITLFCSLVYNKNDNKNLFYSALAGLLFAVPQFLLIFGFNFYLLKFF
jgi:hypothetical protein